MAPRPHPGSDRPLSAPLLPFRLSAEISRLREEPGWKAGKRTITLTKEGGLRVVLVALRAGATLDEHLVVGALTVQVLEGQIRFAAGEESLELAAGDLLALSPAVPHDVQAVDESVLLLTLAQPVEG